MMHTMELKSSVRRADAGKEAPLDPRTGKPVRPRRRRSLSRSAAGCYKDTKQFVKKHERKIEEMKKGIESEISMKKKETMQVTLKNMQTDEMYLQAIADREAADIQAVEDEERAEEVIEAIKGIPAVEFRARCDLIFEKYDKDKDDVLNFEELANLMEAGGQRIEDYEAYASLCTSLGCDVRIGACWKDVYKLFENAPQFFGEEVYRSINPLAMMLKKVQAAEEKTVETEKKLKAVELHARDVEKAMKALEERHEALKTQHAAVKGQLKDAVENNNEKETNDKVEKIFKEYIKYLEAIDIFSSLKADEKMEVAKNLNEQSFSKGETIFDQGEKGETFYILYDGSVQVVKDGKEVAKVTGTPTKASIFGELALLNAEARPATIKVLSDTAKFLSMDKVSFDLLLGPLEDIKKRGATGESKVGKGGESAMNEKIAKEAAAGGSAGKPKVYRKDPAGEAEQEPAEAEDAPFIEESEEEESESEQEMELAPQPRRRSAFWDWPLSRQEKLERLKMLDHRMTVLDVNSLKQELEVARFHLRKMSVGGGE